MIFFMEEHRLPINFPSPFSSPRFWWPCKCGGWRGQILKTWRDFPHINQNNVKKTRSNSRLLKISQTFFKKCFYTKLSLDYWRFPAHFSREMHFPILPLLLFNYSPSFRDKIGAKPSPPAAVCNREERMHFKASSSLPPPFNHAAKCPTERDLTHILQRFLGRRVVLKPVLNVPRRPLLKWGFV